MALEHQTTQTEQGAAVVAPVVHAFFQRRNDRRSSYGRQFCKQVARELQTQKINNHGGQAFAGLERHIANKAVAHHNVRLAFENIVALHITDKIELAGQGRSA